MKRKVQGKFGHFLILINDMGKWFILDEIYFMWDVRVCCDSFYDIFGMLLVGWDEEKD